MYKNILVAVDGSEHASKAANAAGELARLSGGNLTVINAYEEVPTYLGEPNLQNAIEERTNRSRAVLGEAVQQIGEIPGNLVAEPLEGSPAEVILRVAEARGIDLIVMGTRGLGQIAGLLMGSQSQKVVSLAPCPVLLVR
jgi:nucleotide-binding universal stress UspA family protein